MPVIHATDAAPFETHGSRFLSYVSPSRGSSQLCAWQLTVPADLHGVAHRPTREEVLLVLTGELNVSTARPPRCNPATSSLSLPGANCGSTQDRTEQPLG